MVSSRRIVLGGVLGLVLTAGLQAPLLAQDSARVTSTARWVAPLVTPGSPAAERARAARLLGQAPVAGSLLQSASTLSPPPGGAAGLALLSPALRAVANSDLPFSFNDGALWAGRGVNLSLMAGARMHAGPATLVLAPELVFSENRAFQTIVYPRTGAPQRSPFASPWYAPPSSLDLFSRPGADSRAQVDPGQSSLTLTVGGLAIGAASESLWWGPGVRNALVMSTQAPGVPHLFLRTARPLRTPLGELEGRWIAGTLTESAFFDTLTSNDHRSLSALALTFRPAGEPGLVLGLARAVYGEREGAGLGASAMFDVFRRVPRDVAFAGEADARDQLLSLFGQWMVPAAGLEAYFEWARFGRLGSLRGLLESPERAQGYTAGLQWARPLGRESAARVQAEATYLEPSSAAPAAVEVSSYASRSVPQGYTQRGQLIGASIGPGASSQWVAADYLAPAWQAGIFAQRIRWDNAALYRLPAPTYLQHDVTLAWGLRGVLRFGALEAAAQASLQTRFNYLYQNVAESIENFRAIDVRNYSLSAELRAFPAAWRAEPQS